MTPSLRVNVHLSYVIALYVLMPMSIQLSMTGQPSIQRNLLAACNRGTIPVQAGHTYGMEHSYSYKIQSY